MRSWLAASSACPVCPSHHLRLCWLPASFRWRGPAAENGWGNNRAAPGTRHRAGEAAAYRPAAPTSEILSEPPHPGVGRLLLVKPESFAGDSG